MTHVRDHFAGWLRAALAMEEQALTAFAAQTRRIESYPDLKARMDEHMAETADDAQALRNLLETFSGVGSGLVLREMAARLAAKAQGVGGLLTSDEIIKNVMNGYSFLHLQIAQYRVLIATADELEEAGALALLREILDRKMKMAGWLEQNMEAVTRVFLMRDERDLMAKR